jgi:molybdopterin-containing oxidoreductase family membrane subunit
MFVGALAAVGFLAGAWGLVDYLRFGHGHTHYGSYVPWGLWVACYSYLVGVSAGVFLLSAVACVFRVKALEPLGKLAWWTALACWIAAMLSIWIDLGHPERAWRLLLRTSWTSVMGWMAWFYSAYALLLVVMLWLSVRRGSSEMEAAQNRNRLCWLSMLGIPLAIAFSGGGGALFGVVGARPYWHTGLLPILFIVGGLLSGTALLTALTYLFGPDRDSQASQDRIVLLGRMVLGLLAFDALLEWAEYSVTYYAAVPSTVEGLKLVLFGPYWWVFWIVHLGLGLVLPAAILIRRGRSAGWVSVASALIAVTFVSVRLNIVIPGLAVEELQGLEATFAHPRLGFAYFPSLTEWLVQIWTVSFAALIFLAGLRWFKLVGRTEGSAHG